jgi:RND family efflux transporter MFP subunit
MTDGFASPRPTRAVRRLLGAGLLAALLAAAAGCGHAPARAPEKKAPEVVVTTPVRHEVADFQDFTGRLEGLRAVDIRSRVSGFVVSAPFKEGDLVREGELLFLIDPRPYQADLNQADANLKLAKADQNLQQKNVARARALVSSKAVSQEEYDASVAACEKSQATVASSAATRDRAQLYLDYTRVTAPMGGRVSRRFVDPGNLVNADNTLLTSLVSDDKLYAYFDVDERTYLDLAGASSPAGSALAGRLHFPVLLGLANEEQFSRAGVVDFVDNRVNAGTGTVRLRAVFDNPTGALRAGLFARIRLPAGTPYTALVVPDEALLSDQGRKYVYVVGAGDEVAYRPVTPGQELAGLRVIKEGVAEGDRVVVGGMQKIRAGVKVRVRAQDPPKPPESPLAKLLGSNHPAPAAPPAGGPPAGQADRGAKGPGEGAAGKQAPGPARSGG